MYNFKLRLVNRIVAVSAFHAETVEYCADYLTDGGEPDASVSVSEGDFAVELEKTLKENPDGPIPDEKMLEVTIVLRKIAEALVDFGIILFHASAVALDGEAYLFTAKSGTGKSTHTRLWREAFGERAVMINDDKPFIELTEDGATVWGSPWNGKHRTGTNTSAPLKAICVLNRGEHNEIEKMDIMRAFPTVLGQTYRFSDGEKMKTTLTLVDKMLRRTSTYSLRCNMEPEAALVSCNGMRGDTK